MEMKKVLNVGGHSKEIPLQQSSSTSGVATLVDDSVELRKKSHFYTRPGEFNGPKAIARSLTLPRLAQRSLFKLLIGKVFRNWNGYFSSGGPLRATQKRRHKTPLFNLRHMVSQYRVENSAFAI